MGRRVVAVVGLIVAGLVVWGVWLVGAGPAADDVSGIESEPPQTVEAATVDGRAESGTQTSTPTPSTRKRRRERKRSAQTKRKPAPAPRNRRRAGWMNTILVDLSGHTAADLAEDIDGFREHFETDAPGVVVDGANAEAVDVAIDGTTLRFAAGSHVWDTRALNKRDRWPRHLTVDGAGMDVTLVRISEGISSRGELTALTLRDLTIHCNDDGLTDLRSRQPASIRLVRCRVIGFDGGHGGCDLFNGNVGAFLAEDSRVETGFGGSPGSTELLDVRGGACVVRLERCTIVGPFNHTMFFASAKHACVLVGCELRDMYPRSRAEIETSSSVRLRDCDISYLDGASQPRRETRPVSDLNPEWILQQIPSR